MRRYKSSKPMSGYPQLIQELGSFVCANRRYLDADSCAGPTESLPLDSAMIVKFPPRLASGSCVITVRTFATESC
jgi:hypothetical protein